MTSRGSVWLLQFEWAGTVWRFATEAITVSNRTGDELHFPAGLHEVTLPKALQSLDREVAKLRVSTHVDWSAVERRTAIPLHGQRGELRRVSPRDLQLGTAWEDLSCWASGSIRTAQWGERGAPLDLDLSRAMAGEPEPVIPVAAVVTPETQPATDTMVLPSESEGRRYPLVIGRPNGVPGTITRLEDVYAVSSTNEVLIALGEVAATQVRFRCPELHVSAVKDVLTGRDPLGQVYSYVHVTDGGIEIDPAGEHPVYVDFDVDGGGALKLGSGEAATGAGDVIAILGTRFPGSTWDLGAMESCRRILNQVRVDTFVDGEIDALAWLERELLPFLPGTWAHSGRGVYYQPLDFQAPAHHARWTIRSVRDGGTASRIEDPKVDTDDVRNELVLHFGRRVERAESPWVMVNSLTGEEVQVEPAEGDYLYTARLKPTGVQLTRDDRTHPDLGCLVSQGRWGVRPWEGTCLIVDQWDSAWSILRMLAARHVFPKTRIAYEGPAEWEDVRVGDVVTVYDSEIEVNGRTGIVENVWIGGTRPTLDVVLLDDTHGAS